MSNCTEAYATHIKVISFFSCGATSCIACNGPSLSVYAPVVYINFAVIVAAVVETRAER